MSYEDLYDFADQTGWPGGVKNGQHFEGVEQQLSESTNSDVPISNFQSGMLYGVTLGSNTEKHIELEDRKNKSSKG